MDKKEDRYQEGYNEAVRDIVAERGVYKGIDTDLNIMLEDYLEKVEDRASLDLLRKIIDREGYTDETIVKRMTKEFLRLLKLTKQK